MRRFILLLVTLGALYWVWQGLAHEDPALAADGGLAGIVPAEPQGASLQVSAPDPRAEARDEAAGGVRRREPEALRTGYRRLLDMQGEPRRRLAAALAEAGAADPNAALDALGDGNAFLHSQEGRAEAKRIVAHAATLAPDAALPIFTRLIELAMRGRIELSDTEARAMVDEILVAYRSPLNRTVFNPEYLAGARSHRVAPGEKLVNIARAYRAQGLKLDYGTIALFNRIDDPGKLRAGQVLKIPVEPIRSVVEKRSYLLAMYVGEVIFRVYWVGHGKDDLTPETTFKVIDKTPQPTWYTGGRAIPYGHPDNILGHYFVKFGHESLPSFGAHGTKSPETIGTMASQGCIRMRDPEIEEFFKIVPLETTVEIRSTVSIGSR